MCHMTNAPIQPIFIECLLYVPSSELVTAIITSLDAALIYIACLGPVDVQLENPWSILLPSLSTARKTYSEVYSRGSTVSHHPGRGNGPSDTDASCNSVMPLHY
jgi:hypothetical protein